MLRDQDYLLTLAALWALVASLNLRPPLVQQASAIEAHDLPRFDVLLTSQNSSDGKASNSHYQSQPVIDQMMQKIHRNIKNIYQPGEQQARPNNNHKHQHQPQASDTSNNNQQHSQNSYSHYASKLLVGGSELQNQQQRQEHLQKHLRPQEVQVDFLRSPDSDESSAPANNHINGDQRQPKGANATNTVYMLNKQSQLDEPFELLGRAEQQQRPPFILNQVNQQQLAQNPMSNPQLRDILINYQRMAQNNPNALDPSRIAQLLQQNPQILQQNPQLQQGLAALQQAQPQQQQPRTQSRPQLQPVREQQQPQKQLSLQQPQQQQQPLQALNPFAGAPGQGQPMSALQMLAAPFQAFLPGGQANANLLNQNNNNNNARQASPANQRLVPTTPATGAGSPTGSGQALQHQQQPQMGLFQNPFAAFGQQQQQQQQPGQFPNLQTLYQQLPLYQSLLAARQRQEALDAAQRLRQQQLLGSNGAALGQNQLAGVQQQQPNLGSFQPANGSPQQQSFGVTNLQQPQTNNALAPLGQPPQDTNPNAGQVQFDDDQNQQQPQPQPVPVAPVGGSNASRQPEPNNNNREPDAKDETDDEAGSKSNDSDADQNNANNTGGGSEAGNNNSEEQDGGSGGGQQDGGPTEPEAPSQPQQEDDPDLKEFQNLANGNGDSFADLIPPGLLSNNDMNEYKNMQKEQAKRQEEEERRKQMQQQQQQQQQQPQQQQPDRAAGNNNQPDEGNSIDSGTNNSADTPTDNANNNQGDEPESNQGGDDSNGDGQGGTEEEPADEDAGGGQAGGGSDEDDGQANPMAAALTSKSAEGASGGGGSIATSLKAERYTSSPGVVYSQTAAG